MRYFVVLIGVLFLFGCATVEKESVIEEARQLISEGKAECIIVRDNEMALVERGRGVSPLMRIYEQHPEVLQGGVVVDKVIGRAAGFIAIAGGAKHVHGEVMSEDAVELLTSYKITSSCKLLVPRILNRNRDGLCPLEDSVLKSKTPEEALPALRKRIAELMPGK